jgi:hypothetical protein
MSSKIIEHVQRVAARHFDIKTEDMMKRNRNKTYVFARHITAYILHRYYRITLKEISEAFNDRHHSTILHSVNLIEDYISIEDTKTCNDITAIFSKVKVLNECNVNVFICLNLKLHDVMKFGGEAECEKELINFVRNYTPAY